MASYFLPNEPKWKVFLFWRNINPDWLSLALRTTSVSLITLAISWFFPDHASPFFILASVLFMFTSPTETKKVQMQCQLFGGVLTMMSVFFVTLASSTLYGLIPLLALFSFVAISVGYWGLSTYGTAGMLSVLTMITAAGMPMPGLESASLRAAYCFAGLILALLMNAFFLNRHPQKQFRHTLIDLTQTAADFFCHAASDSVRGNYIHARHWQLKEKLLQQLDRAERYATVCQSKKDTAACRLRSYVFLQDIYQAERKWLEVMFTLSNVMTNPANNRVLILIVPELIHLRQSIVDFLLALKEYLTQESGNLAGPTHSYAEIQKKIIVTFQDLIKQETIFNWPFDLNSLSVLLDELELAKKNIIRVVEKS